MEAFMRQQNQVSLAVMSGPVMPMVQVKQGEDPQRVIATQAAAAIETWLVYQALGYTAGVGEQWMAKRLATRAMVGAAAPVYPIVAAGAAVAASGQYVTAMEGYAPEDPAQKSSFMNSVAAAMAGTFGGMTIE
jgi:hypothetical protein